MDPSVLVKMDQTHDGLEKKPVINIATTSLCLTVELCLVCGDRASGRHYGAISCEGCKGFFKRSIRKQLGYQCRGTMNCEVTKHHRNRCQYCRLQKCLSCGMRSDSVQHERKPILEKKESTSSFCNNTNTYSSNNVNKIFIRKDLATETAIPVYPVGFNIADLNISILNKKAAASNTIDMPFHMSPGQTSLDDENSQDIPTVLPTDLSEAFSIAFEKNVISNALSTMAKVHDGSDGEIDTLFEFEGPLLPENIIPFNLQSPNPVPAYLNIHYICESGSRLLFLSVHWARSIPAFQLLSSETQVALLRGSWAELFTLGLVQCSQMLSLTTILSSLITHLTSSISQDKLSATKVKQMSDHIYKLKDYVTTMSRLHVDEHEYAYLKTIALFKADHPGILVRQKIEGLQEKSFQALRNYVQHSFPEDEDRFPRLLLRLPPLRSFEPSILEELFFAGLIGQVQVESVIPYILRNGAPSAPGRQVKVEQSDDFK